GAERPCGYATAWRRSAPRSAVDSPGTSTPRPPACSRRRTSRIRKASWARATSCQGGRDSAACVSSGADLRVWSRSGWSGSVRRVGQPLPAILGGLGAEGVDARLCGRRFWRQSHPHQLVDLLALGGEPADVEHDDAVAVRLAAGDLYDVALEAVEGDCPRLAD